MSIDKFWDNWEKILEEEWLWDLDKDYWFYEESIIESDIWKNNFDIEDILNLWLNFKELLEKFSKEKNIYANINFNKNIFSIFNKSNNSLIWEIKLAKYNDNWFKRDVHLYNVIEDDYKWKWFWKILFLLYKKLTEENSDFILPEEEYTNIVSMINLYKKFWYKPEYKVLKWFSNNLIPLTKDDFKDMEKIINDYKLWNKEEKLDYTVILNFEE